MAMASLRWVETPSTHRLAAVNRLLDDFVHEVLPDEPDTPVEMLVSEIADAPTHRRVHVLEALEDREIVGCAELVLDDVVGRNLVAWVKTLVVTPERRRRGIGTAMVAAILDRSRAEGRERLQTFVPTTHDAGRSFAAALGARRSGIVTHQNRVGTADLDRAMLERWIVRAQERTEEYSLVCFDRRCPAKWLSQFTEIVAVMNTAPRSEQEDDTLYSSEQILEQEEAHLSAGGWSWTVCA
jgi:GNAT superfamily N-acetyltransferase